MIMMHSNDVKSYETSCSFSTTPSSGGNGTHRNGKVFSALLVARRQAHSRSIDEKLLLCDSDCSPRGNKKTRVVFLGRGEEAKEEAFVTWMNSRIALRVETSWKSREFIQL
jgi:hypothetical protein